MNKKIVFLINFFILIIIFFPINIVIEDKNNDLKIFSTGINVIYYKNEQMNNFSEKKFLFYNSIKYDEYLILNYSNYSTRFTFSNYKIQDQFNKQQAYFFHKDKEGFYKKNDVYYTNKWLKTPIFNSFNFFKLFIDDISFKNKYFLFTDQFRSFHVKPDVIFISNVKDIVHEISHSLIDSKIDHETNDIWPELISEANSLMYLKLTNELKYLNEVELKQINYYVPPYSRDILNFLDNFDYDIKTYTYFLKHLFDDYDYMNDDIFNEVIHKFKGESL